MKNLFKYAASYWKAMIAIVLILVVQAYCDLSLPAYTSDIVNVGIQQGGIEDEVPRQIATEEMEKLLLFVSEDDQQTVIDAYTEDNTSYKKEAYVLKDSVAEEENTMENPCKIVPRTSTHKGFGANFNYTFQPNSFTVLRIKVDK